MNAYLLILFSICGITFYGNCLPYRDIWSKYQKRDDYYEDYYLRRVPKVRTTPGKVNEFLVSQVSWFPVSYAETDSRPSKRTEVWNVTIDNVRQCYKCEPYSKSGNVSKMTKIRQKVKSMGRRIPGNWTKIKHKSSDSMRKVGKYIKKTNFKQLVKNVTHPLRYKGSKACDKKKKKNETEVDEICGKPPKCVSHNHPKSSHVETIKVPSSTFPPCECEEQPPKVASECEKCKPKSKSKPKSTAFKSFDGGKPNCKKQKENSDSSTLHQFSETEQQSGRNIFALPVLYPLFGPLHFPYYYYYYVQCAPVDSPKPKQHAKQSNRNLGILGFQNADESGQTSPNKMADADKFKISKEAIRGRQHFLPVLTQKYPIQRSWEDDGQPTASVESRKDNQQPSDTDRFSQYYEQQYSAKSPMYNPATTPSERTKSYHEQFVTENPMLKYPEVPAFTESPSRYKEVSTSPKIPSAWYYQQAPKFLGPSWYYMQPYISMRYWRHYPKQYDPAQQFRALYAATRPWKYFRNSDTSGEHYVVPVRHYYRKHFNPSRFSQRHETMKGSKKLDHYSKFKISSGNSKILNSENSDKEVSTLTFTEVPQEHQTMKTEDNSNGAESSTKPSKVERDVRQEESYLTNLEGDNANSTNMLETAGEMASDLAGRMTSLWHCVLGTHRMPDTKDVKFYLYTRRNIVKPELLFVNYDLINQRMKDGLREDVNCVDLPPDQIADFQRISNQNREIVRSNFLNIRAPTKIVIHGYTGSYKDSRMARIKDAYLEIGRYNVIQVDWEMLAAPPCYIRVTHHSKFVGETIAQFLNGLYFAGLNMSLVHLIGFSLGAQVAGFTGNNVTVTPVCRITGLDPALPLFLHTRPSGHLDKLDAKFVDVIHTCGGILAMLDPLGHVDFYPNGGTRQPGCEFSNLKCSHSRAPQYFAESVSSQKKFTGQLCLTWEEYVAGDCDNNSDISYMGEPCSRRSVSGKYYLLTKSKEPFAL